MRMLESRGQQDLALESFGADSRGEVRRQHLDDHAPSEGALFGDEDAAHATATELSLQCIRARQRDLERIVKARRHRRTITMCA